jgi:integrase
VTGSSQQHQGAPGLLERLVAAVRAEFRVDVLVPDVDDLILGAPECVVAGCDRPSDHRGSGLCGGHLQRWRQQGRPDLAGFIAATTPHTFGRGPLQPCAVPGCRRGRASRGLCGRHACRWRRAGQPEVAGWAAAAAALAPAVPLVCRLPACQLWTDAPDQPLCRSHLNRWRVWQRRTGRADLEEFLRHCQAYALDQIDLRGLPAQLKLELQYALQCRTDQRRGKLPPRDARLVVRVVAASGASSLLAWPEAAWDALFDSRAHAERARYTIARGFLRFAWQRVDELACPPGWEAEYPRDVWDLRRLGIPFSATRRLRFDRIPQPWLRELAKRWVRWKLGTGISAGQAARDVGNLAAFAAFLAAPTVQVTALAELSRQVLERYAAQAASSPRADRTRAGYVGTVQAFLLAIRQHRWDPTLPAEASFYPEDYPKRSQLPPRALSELVMAQVEHPDNLARLADPTVRLCTLLLIRTGLRVGDATRLAFDCVVCDAQGAPYLRYFNHKMQREALVPIDEELLAEIAAQQQRVLARWSKPTVLLPRPKANPDGRWPLPVTTYHLRLRQWLSALDLRDEHGCPVHLTPHQWRHTFGTRLINLDVPQEVVRQLLDHDSHAMTAHYARLHDQTVRRHWERARKVNIAGQPVTIDPDGPLAAAAWAKDRLARAKQSLPNGYCGLPLQQTCPHANACLTCPVFITTPDFLPQHHQQREHTRTLIATAQTAGQERIVEMNQQVLANLDRIITALEADHDPAGTDPTGEQVADAG